MSLTLVVSCSNHQKKDGTWGREIRLQLEGPKDFTRAALKAAIEKNHGWHVQFNGDHMDTYCSKQCAV